MEAILKHDLAPDKAALWFLGQAGYRIRSAGTTVVIDPYLSDSVARVDPEYARAFPVPLDPTDLQADIFIVTHDHLDHLDPETVGPYRYKDTTLFVAPRLACRKLIELGIPEKNLRKTDCGVTAILPGVRVTGITAVPTEPKVEDTTGYLLEFANGRSVYHTSDTGPSAELLDKAPGAEVLLTCINGKFGNLDIGQAVQLALKVRADYTIPNHYDLMALNAEDPQKFKKALEAADPGLKTRILTLMEPFTWP